MLKLCKDKLGPYGKPVKSYYMKTALFWLCQDTDVEQWTGTMHGMRMILDYLEKAIDARYLGCFFWSEINLFRQLSPADLAAMRHTLSLLRRNMTRLLVQDISPHINTMAQLISHEPSEQPLERQLRVCLARYMLIMAIRDGLRFRGPHIDTDTTRIIQEDIQVGVALERTCALQLRLNQSCMFLALTVAPADIMDQCRLTSLGDDVYSWDAAPLIGLLTQKDLKVLLGDPAAVDAWLKERHGLPADLSSARARADLLLSPALLDKALRESVPRRRENDMRQMFKPSSFIMPTVTFDEDSRNHQKLWTCKTTVDVFQSLPRQENQSVLCHYINSWEAARQFLADPRTRAEYERLRRCRLDPWRLRQYVFTDSQ